MPSDMPKAPVPDAREIWGRGGRWKKMDRLTDAFHDEYLFLPLTETSCCFLIRSLYVCHCSTKGLSGSVLSSDPTLETGRGEHD